MHFFSEIKFKFNAHFGWEGTKSKLDNNVPCYLYVISSESVENQGKLSNFLTEVTKAFLVQIKNSNFTLLKLMRGCSLTFLD